MTNNITNLAAHRATVEHDNRLWSPIDCLEDCIQSIRNGDVHVDRLLILRLDVGEGDQFNAGYNAANINGSSALALLEVVKAVILADMGYIARKGGDE